MRPTLRQLQYLVAVADTGRFGEAAKFLNVSQPSLSAQIAEAEAQLGVVLVERGRTGALMTPVGEDIVRRARIVLRQVEDLKTAARQGDAGLAGRLRLGVLPSIGPYLLPRAVKRLHGQYPDLRLSVRDERTIDLETKLHDGRLDAVISTPEDHVEDETLNLFSERLWICAAPDDPLAGDKSAVRLDDLEGRILMSLGYGHRLNLMVQALADAAGAHVSGEYEGTSLDALRQMAAMGVGLAILPSLYALSEAKRADDIVVRPIDHPLAARDISLIWRATSPLAASFETLGGVLKDVANHLLKGQNQSTS